MRDEYGCCVRGADGVYRALADVVRAVGDRAEVDGEAAEYGGRLLPAQGRRGRAAEQGRLCSDKQLG